MQDPLKTDQSSVSVNNNKKAAVAVKNSSSTSCNTGLVRNGNVDCDNSYFPYIGISEEFKQILVNILYDAPTV